MTHTNVKDFFRTGQKVINTHEYGYWIGTRVLH